MIYLHQYMTRVISAFCKGLIFAKYNPHTSQNLQNNTVMFHSEQVTYITIIKSLSDSN